MAENSRKSAGRPFEPGKSGNPGGRPKKTQEDLDLIAACKEKTREALETLLEVMRTGNEKNRITAAIAIIERGHGKPIQQTETQHSGNIDSRIEWVIVDANTGRS